MKRVWAWVAAIVIIIAIPVSIMYVMQYGGHQYYAQVGELTRTETMRQSNGKVMGKAYVYDMIGYDKSGAARKFTVKSMAGVKFVKGHYVKVLWSRAKGVKSYERVSWQSIPKPAQKAINH
ncbi:YxeA family protein [Secundilactobacillus odoratitofui]|nr:YxeA family protein [Secundilactobacillus odoratitofui]